MKIDSGIILEIGGGLSTLLLSRVAKKTNNRIRVVEKSEFWRQFIQSRLILPNVMFMNDPDFLNVDLIFIDTDFTISNPSFYQIIVDNREALCNKMGIPFYRKLKIGHNLG
jgi:tRNA1(Val) A37 N6-methylase TrmN6